MVKFHTCMSLVNYGIYLSNAHLIFFKAYQLPIQNAKRYGCGVQGELDSPLDP